MEKGRVGEKEGQKKKGREEIRKEERTEKSDWSEKKEARK